MSAVMPSVMSTVMSTGIASRTLCRAPQRGFSMIEVLVTLLIISLALLGTAGLQAYALRQGQGAQFRTLAVLLAADLAERMEANKTAASTGDYVLATTQRAAFLAGGNAVSSACTNATCSAAALAQYDLSQWQNAVAANLPQSSWSVSQAVVGSASTYTITLGWVDRVVNTTRAAYSASSAVGADAAGTGERFSYTATRTILTP